MLDDGAVAQLADPDTVYNRPASARVARFLNCYNIFEGRIENGQFRRDAMALPCPAGAPAHVHADQHAMTGMIPSVGTDSGNELLYFANDGGVYRTLNGFSGLSSGSCSALNQFDDLNQNLGSLAQFVSFSQHPSDRNMLLGGMQGNGSAATSAASSSTAWVSVLGGDGAPGVRTLPEPFAQ